MDGLLGVAGMIITRDYGSFPHSLLSTSKFRNDMEIEMGGTSKINHPVDSRIFHHNHPYWGTFIDGNLYMYVHIYIYIDHPVDPSTF